MEISQRDYNLLAPALRSFQKLVDETFNREEQIELIEKRKVMVTADDLSKIKDDVTLENRMDLKSFGLLIINHFDKMKEKNGGKDITLGTKVIDEIYHHINKLTPGYEGVSLDEYKTFCDGTVSIN